MEFIIMVNVLYVKHNMVVYMKKIMQQVSNTLGNSILLTFEQYFSFICKASEEIYILPYSQILSPNRLLTGSGIYFKHFLYRFNIWFIIQSHFIIKQNSRKDNASDCVCYEQFIILLFIYKPRIITWKVRNQSCPVPKIKI